MAEEKLVKHNFELLSYEYQWENFKKEFNLTEEQVIEQIRIELQLMAWGDIITERAEYLRKLKPDDLKQEIGE